MGLELEEGSTCLYFPRFVWSFICIKYAGAGGNGLFGTSVLRGENAPKVMMLTLRVCLIHAALAAKNYSR